MGGINFFESVEHMEPRCPKCNIVLDYGTNTDFNDKCQCHVCNQCGTELR